LLDVFQIQTGVLDASKYSYYPNITGFIHGDAEFRNITLPSLASNETLPWKQQATQFMAQLNTTNITDRLGSWNWTASTKIALSLVEKKPSEQHSALLQSDPIALVHVRSGHNYQPQRTHVEQGRIELTDPSNSDNLRLEFQGIHFISNGSMYGFAEPSG